MRNIFISSSPPSFTQSYGAGWKLWTFRVDIFSSFLSDSTSTYLLTIYILLILELELEGRVEGIDLWVSHYNYFSSQLTISAHPVCGQTTLIRLHWTEKTFYQIFASSLIKSRKVYCSDWSRWLISVVWVVRVARVVPIVFPEPVDTFSHRDFENWTPTRKVSHQCCETMEPMLETMEQTHKTLTTQNGFNRHFVVLHIQPISHWTIQLAIIIKTITIIAIHGMIQLTIN